VWRYNIHYDEKMVHHIVWRRLACVHFTLQNKMYSSTLLCVIVLHFDSGEMCESGDAKKEDSWSFCRQTFFKSQAVSHHIMSNDS